MVTNEIKHMGKHLMGVAFFILNALLITYVHSLQRPESELADLVPLPYFPCTYTRHSDRLHDFLSPFLDVRRMSMSIVFFLAQLGFEIFCL